MEADDDDDDVCRRRRTVVSQYACMRGEEMNDDKSNDGRTYIRVGSRERPNNKMKLGLVVVGLYLHVEKTSKDQGKKIHTNINRQNTHRVKGGKY